GLPAAGRAPDPVLAGAPGLVADEVDRPVGDRPGRQDRRGPLDPVAPDPPVDRDLLGLQRVVADVRDQVLVDVLVLGRVSVEAGVVGADPVERPVDGVAPHDDPPGPTGRPDPGRLVALADAVLRVGAAVGVDDPALD